MQLEEASKLCTRHPSVKVCIDHMTKPRCLLGLEEPSDTNSVLNAEEPDVWRRGMTLMAAPPQVHVKLSTLGYAVPGLIRNQEHVTLVKMLVKEAVNLFGANRCMIALNWFKDGLN